MICFINRVCPSEQEVGSIRAVPLLICGESLLFLLVYVGFIERMLALVANCSAMRLALLVLHHSSLAWYIGIVRGGSADSAFAYLFIHMEWVM